MATAASVFVGIDVAKAELVMAIRPSGKRWTATNDDAGIQELLTRLREEAPALVVLEATGGYERAAGAALATAGLPLVVANPRQVRDFVRATGQLAKTVGSTPTRWPSSPSACGLILARCSTRAPRPWTP
jgi:transposase